MTRISNRILTALLVAVAVAWLVAASVAHAQSVLTPITSGLVWTPAQWTAAWVGKQDFPATTAMRPLVWTTGTRPGTPSPGWFGYNSTLGAIEWWDGSSWVASGGGGGGVNAGTTNQVATYLASGNQVTGASYVNLQFPPTLPTSPTGNPTGGSLASTYSSLIAQGTTNRGTTNREFLANIGLTSTQGAGAVNGNGDKVGLYVGAQGQSGTGDLWSTNFLLTMATGSGTYNAQTVEVDFNPLSVDMGGTDGSGGLPAKVGNGISISGASDSNAYTGTAALSLISFGGPSLNVPLWSRGAMYNGYYKFADEAHYAISPVGEDFAGVYSTAAIRLANDQKILFLGSSGGTTYVAGPPAGNWTLTLPADAGTTGQVLTTDGAGTTSWTAAAGGGGVNPGTAGQVGWYATGGSVVSGSTKIFQDTGTGFVGINTAVPGSQLTVNGTFAASGNASIGGSFFVASSLQFAAYTSGCLQTNGSGVVSTTSCGGITGPGSSTAGHFAVWSDTSGTALSNTAFSTSDFVARISGSCVGCDLGNTTTVSGTGALGIDFAAGFSSQTDAIRIKNTQRILARNNANSADITIFAPQTDDTVRICNTNCVALVVGNGKNLIPSSDNNASVGISGQRWSAIWAANGTIQTSDLREKDVLGPSDLGLSFIRELDPIAFTWKAKPEEGTHYGFGAQDIERVLGSRSFAALHRPGRDGDHYGLVLDELIAPVVRGVQELASDADSRDARIAILEGRIHDLEDRLARRDIQLLPATFPSPSYENSTIPVRH